MHLYLDHLLANRYPATFADSDRPPTETGAAWGCDHGDGWYPLLDVLFHLLNAHAAVSGLEAPAAGGIKQKFGLLRCRVSGCDDWGRGAVQMAERLSGVICEETGTPGVPCTMPSGWMMVRSPDIIRMRQYRISEREPVDLPGWVAAVPVTGAELAERHRWILDGPVDVPSGWLDVVDGLLEMLGRKRGPVVGDSPSGLSMRVGGPPRPPAQSPCGLPGSTAVRGNWWSGRRAGSMPVPKELSLVPWPSPAGAIR